MSETAELRMQRMRDFLRAYHGGKDPQPRRTYLDLSEAESVMMHNPRAVSIVTRDLDIRGYSIRWRNSIECAICDGEDPAGWDFWLRARRHFLEIGGGYKPEYQPPVDTTR